MAKKLVLVLLSILFLLSYTNTGKETRASYYSKEHHGKRTASGERFNMYALTAAHKTLAFGIKLKVTNLKNEKTVIVRINDRGPFIKNRGLDLSYQAMKDLNGLNSGVIPVRYEIIN